MKFKCFIGMHHFVLVGSQQAAGVKVWIFKCVYCPKHRVESETSDN